MSSNSSRRVLRGALSVVALLGVAIALSPALQSASAWWSQRQLRAEWDASRLASPKPSPAARPKPQIRSAVAARGSGHEAVKSNARRLKGDAGGQASAVTMSAQSQGRRRPSASLPPTQLKIPEIGVDAIVVQGLDAAALARGPGHDPASALPGQDGNCVLAAHRNVYGSWFYNLDQLWAGSVIELESGGQTFRYSVASLQSVSEADGSVLRSQPGAPPSLTLITCTLPHSPYRLVATAYLQGP